VTRYSIVASALPPGLRRRHTRGVDRWLRAKPQGEASACRGGVAGTSARLAAQIRREISGEVWRGTPRLVYGLVYKGLRPLARASPKLRLSCKS